tara:strand:+ start:174 stop:311 length:138 start_codon:yes stop_codon:yes gene_type:complete
MTAHYLEEQSIQSLVSLADVLNGAIKEETLLRSNLIHNKVSERSE